MRRGLADEVQRRNRPGARPDLDIDAFFAGIERERRIDRMGIEAAVDLARLRGHGHQGHGESRRQKHLLHGGFSSASDSAPCIHELALG